MAVKTVRRAELNALESDWVDVNLLLLGKQRRDLDLSSSDITARIFRLREIFVKVLDRTHAQFGLKPRMFLVLAALYRSGPPYTLSPANLMRHLMWSSGGLSQLLDRMVSARLISRQADLDDRRGVLVRLSAEGQRVMDAVLSAHYQAEHRLVAGLSKSELSTLATLLRKLLIAAEGPQVPPSKGVPRASRSRIKVVR
jgi:DNA-binding MarR family transcriptional regulator